MKKYNHYFSNEKLKQNLKKRSVTGAGATIFNQGAVYFIQIISTIILARILTPDDFGIVAMVLSIYVFFRMFRNFGLMDATVQRENINHRMVSTLFWINLSFGFGMTVIFICTAPLISWFFGEPKLTLIAIIMSLDFVLGGISVQHRGLIKRNIQMYRWSGIQISSTIVSFSTAIIMALNGFGYWSLVARHVVFAMTEAASSWILCHWRPGLPARGSGIRPMIKFGLNMLGSFTIKYLLENIDKILIGWRYGAQSLGFYHKAYHLFLAPAQQISYPLTNVAVATLSRLLDDPDKYKRYFFKAISIVAFVGMPISAIFAVTAKDLVVLLLGSQWARTGDLLSIFGIGVGVQLLYATHEWLHISFGRADRWLKWNIIGVIVSSIAFFIGLPFGAEGIAAAYCCALYILLLPSIWYAGKPVNLKISKVISIIWKYYISAFCSAIICWFIFYSKKNQLSWANELDIFFRLILASGLCLIIYLMLIIILYNGLMPIKNFWDVATDILPFSIRKKRASTK